MNTKTTTIFVLVMSLIISGCAPGQLFGPTITPTFTPTFTPTITPSPLPPTFTPNPTATATIIPTSLPTSVITLDDAPIGQWQLIALEIQKTNLAINKDVFWFVEFSSDGTVSTNIADSFSKSNYKINGNHIVLLDQLRSGFLCGDLEYAIDGNLLTLKCSDDDVIYYLKKTQP